MKANELRLGNYVMDGHDIEKVNYKMIEMLVKNQAEFDPIPLTEDWLLKFGFSKHLVYDFYSYNYFYFESFYDEGYFLVVEGGHVNTKGIKYVHDLQNLLYDLEGKELTLNESKIQTSVEWFVDQLRNGKEITDKLIRQANEIEEQRIKEIREEAYTNGQLDSKNTTTGHVVEPDNSLTNKSA